MFPQAIRLTREEERLLEETLKLCGVKQKPRTESNVVEASIHRCGCFDAMKLAPRLTLKPCLRVPKATRLDNARSTLMNHKEKM